MKISHIKGFVITIILIAVIFAVVKTIQKPKVETYTIQIESGNYFCANQNQNYIITTDKVKAYDWEQFTFYFVEPGKVRIKTFFDKYVYVNKDGILQADKDFTEEEVQIFDLKKNENNRYSLLFSGESINLTKEGFLKVERSTENINISQLKLDLKESNSKHGTNEKLNFFNILILLISLLFTIFYNKIETIKINPKFIYLLPIVAFCYILVRAFNISFLIDEAMSYDILVNKPYYFNALFFDDSEHYIANNHVLNTVFGYISYYVFGNNPFAFRVFNVLAFVLYSYYTLKVIKLLSKSVASTYIAIVLLFLNPFMLEFFSLYRGYGLSLTFLSGIIYYFSKLYIKGYDQKTLVYGLVASFLAVYANFALIIPVFVFQLLYFIHLNKNKSIDLIITQKSTYLFVICGVALIPAISNILILSKLKELYFGGSTSFLKDTLDSIINYTFYTRNKLDAIIIEIIILSLIFSSLFFSKNKRLFSVTILIVTTVLLSTILNHLTESKFVIERASLYFVPLLGLFVLNAWDNKIKNKGLKMLIMVFICFLTTSAAVKGVKSYNLYKTTTWPHDIDNKNVLKDILKLNENKDFSVAVFWIFESSCIYYKDYYQLDQLKEIKRLGSNKEIEAGNDFYYIRKGDLNRVKFKYKVVKEYEKSETLILVQE